ncbi:hypothetical protein N7539_005407 [Penicillium diatomitis]|uniref:Uncharacterized protein n=1 Tax=Penicillium diatomitis TaxID=2819901 RepID=A0A9W9X7A6_9EURO|nr:uncharacterized protein N7539_005407 [Penicillium diatomitis]KAJ5485419.1 hypothetical protein N7539_005407 [Penicillium diatomitis]
MEVLSPHLAETDQELWLELIKRDIPQWQKYELPQNSNSWYEIYCDLQAEVQRELEADAAKLKRAIDGIQSERAQLQPKVMNSIPRGVRGSRGRVVPRGPMSSADARKKSAIFAPQRRNPALIVPTKHLNNRATQITKAPLSLIEAHRRPADPPAPTREAAAGRISVPGKMLSKSTRPLPALHSSSALADREARLRAIAAGKPIPPRPLSNSAPTGSTTDRPRRAGNASIPTKESHSPVKKAIPKRKATSPPPQSAAAGGSSTALSGRTAPEMTGRPGIARKRSEVDIFLRPRKKRVV